MIYQTMQKSLNCKSILILFVIFSTILTGQTTDSLRAKNQELDRIKKDISALEKELQAKTKKERESLQALENINQQNLLLNKLINNLLADEKDKEIAIKDIED
ncbi:MAG: hypothetical protein AABZ54_02080, partial [Bacteroidota bacterium]